jgi:ketosteroid isomerase-like protein
MPGQPDSAPTDTRRAADAMRRGYEAVNRRDFATMVESFDPDVEWQDAPQFPGSGVSRGPERIVAEIESFLEIWEELRLELVEVIPVDDRFVAVVDFHVRGRGSKLPLEGAVAHVWTWRDGKVVRMQAFMSREEALAAIGAADGAALRRGEVRAP